MHYKFGTYIFRCECPPGRQLTADHSCIVKVARPTDSCQNGELCMGSFCRNGTCTCLEHGFVLQNRKCVKVNQLKPTSVQQKSTESPHPKATKAPAETSTKKPIIQPLSEALNTQKHKVVLSLMTRSLQANETKKPLSPGKIIRL
jgi:hypothetical protein